jgi:hypothetical protein
MPTLIAKSQSLANLATVPTIVAKLANVVALTANFGVWKM